MRENSVYGTALIGGSALLIAMGLIHPTGAQLLASRETFEHVALINYAAHSLAIAGAWLAMVGLGGFSRLLGSARPVVTAAFLGFALTAVAVIVAAGLDGFVVPQLARRWFDADPASRAALRELMRFCVLIASTLTRIYMVLGSAAVLLWSLGVWNARLSRGLPWVGVLVAVAAVAVTIGGPPFVSVHELLALVLCQAAWMIWAGIILIRAPA